MKMRDEPLDYDSSASATRSRPSTAASAVPSIEVSPDVDDEIRTQPQPKPKRPTTADKGVGGTPEPAGNVKVPEGSIFIDGFKAARMRALINRATSVEECQILVEMFLAQWGVPRVDGEEPDEATLLPYTQGEATEPKEELVDEELHHSMVDALLGEGGAIQELMLDDAQTDDAHDNPPRTPNTPSEAKHPSEAYMPPSALKQDGAFPQEYAGQGPAIVPSSPPAVIAV